MKKVVWEGDSKEVIQTFPKGVKEDLGAVSLNLHHKNWEQHFCAPLFCEKKSKNDNARSGNCDATIESRFGKEQAMTKNSVFEELGFSKEEARILEMKTDLVNKITAIVKRKGYTQNQLKEILGVPQPRVSELLRHKISSTSVEKLLTYLERLGCETSFKFHEKKVG